MNELCITVWNIRKLKEAKKMEIKSCKTHVEHALDMFVAETKSYPILTELSDGEKLSTKCDYCEEAATYLVANE